MTIAATRINAAYACLASASASVIQVDSALVGEFCRWHRELGRVATANQGDLLLDELVRLSFGLWYRVLTVPLSLSHPALIDASAADLLLKRVRAVGDSYGHLSDVRDRYISAFCALRSSNHNPLWGALETDLAQTEVEDVGLLIKPARLVAAFRDLAARHSRRLEVLTESQLRRPVAFDSLYVFGAGRWYPGFVFSAPRAPALKIVRYGFLSDSPPEEAAFVKTLKKPSPPSFTDSSPRNADGSWWIPADEARPALDIGSIIRRASNGGAVGSTGAETELISVRGLFLEQDLVVFVPASEGSSELVIDLREEAENLVHRVPTASLEPGMAVLVRTAGGGDYIAAAADQIMDKVAVGLRSDQRDWKLRLRDLTHERGPAEVIGRLRAAGSMIANHQNLRNWISPRSIRTHNKDDFDAIFRVIGLADDADQYWSRMAVIDRAHRRAGRLIRNRLLKQVQRADLSALQTEGRQDFELPGEVGGGSLTAVRIVAMAAETAEAHSRTLHRLVELAG